MGFIGRGLLDDITIKHGPTPLIARFLIAANRETRARGVTFVLKRDFRELFALNEKHRDCWYQLAPVFNPAFNTVPPEECFWLAGYDEAGDIVATDATRFFDWSGTDLMTEFTGLRLWYDEPERCRMPDEQCLMTAAEGRQITGRSAFSGCIWYRPDFRGRGLSTIMPRINRTVALALWGIDFNIGIVENFIVESGLLAQYGFTNHAPGVGLRNGRKADMDLHLIWMERDEIIADLARWLAQLGDPAGQRTVKPEASRPPLPSRHGRMSRS
jgi:hypothetical protein